MSWRIFSLAICISGPSTSDDSHNKGCSYWQASKGNSQVDMIWTFHLLGQVKSEHPRLVLSFFMILKTSNHCPNFSITSQLCIISAIF
ncbi:hypothetical protein BT96DRAFT_80715 [Gymnopus androsaceus JB14]|uniref:Uncharacterized protein n=1 Tax=Gymnopus androsaceus JB14 TaxID=1447944 RepID=A0A6A4GCZ4_9AGAR|nr:hypothetical protein BT96DRAFT_80715 [Gymnopus androsaceus JB14]